METLGLAPGLRTVFDAPRTAALYGSCLLRTEGSGLGSPKEPPVLGVKSDGVVQCKAKVGIIEKGMNLSESLVTQRRTSVKFIVGCTDSEEEDNGELDQSSSSTSESHSVNDGVGTSEKCLRKCDGTLTTATSVRKRLQSESSSGVSTRYSSSNSSMVSGLSVEEEDDNAGDDVISSESDSAILSDASNGGSGTAQLEKAPNEGVGVEIGPFPINHFVVNPAPLVEIVWSYAVHGDVMVVFAPSSVKKVCGINDAFVTLLEYGENELHCSRAVVLIERNSPDKVCLQRMFTFLGFSALATKDAPLSLREHARDYVFLVTGFDGLEDNDSDLDEE